MQKILILITLLSLTVTSFGQRSKDPLNNMGQNPVIFLDSVETDFAHIDTLSPFDISNIHVIQPKGAKKILGDKGRDGAMYVTTREYARYKYWNFFRLKSDDYKQLLNSPKADSIVQYVLNGHTLSDRSTSGSLFLVDEKIFKKLKIIDNKNFSPDDPKSKKYIVSIKAKRPKGLIKSKNLD